MQEDELLHLALSPLFALVGRGDQQDGLHRGRAEGRAVLSSLAAVWVRIPEADALKWLCNPESGRTRAGIAFVCSRRTRSPRGFALAEDKRMGRYVECAFESEGI